MKKMIYGEGRYRDPIVLMDDYYKGYRFFILNLGTHPCAYVVLPEGHEFHGESYDDIPIGCHYGLTYSEDYLNVYGVPKYLKKQNVWIIGWDYAHSGDYYSGMYSLGKAIKDKKWSTEEIFEEIKDVIEQLL